MVRAGFDALSRGDWDALGELLDPEVEWQTTGQFVEGGVYRGHDGVREFLTTLGGEFDDFRAEAGSITDAGDVVVVETRGSGVGKQSGAQVEIEFTILVDLTEGRVTRLRNFVDRGNALEAAGLEE